SCEARRRRALTAEMAPRRRHLRHPVSTMSVVVVAVVAAVVARRPADTRIDEEREELTSLDELRVGARLVRLDVEQEPAVAQDVGGVDDARRLLVLRDEGGIGRGGAVE